MARLLALAVLASALFAIGLATNECPLPVVDIVQPDFPVLDFDFFLVGESEGTLTPLPDRTRCPVRRGWYGCDRSRCRPGQCTGTYFCDAPVNACVPPASGANRLAQSTYADCCRRVKICYGGIYGLYKNSVAYIVKNETTETNQCNAAGNYACSNSNGDVTCTLSSQGQTASCTAGLTASGQPIPCSASVSTPTITNSVGVQCAATTVTVDCTGGSICAVTTAVSGRDTYQNTVVCKDSSCDGAWNNGYNL